MRSKLARALARAPMPFARETTESIVASTLPSIDTVKHELNAPIDSLNYYIPERYNKMFREESPSPTLQSQVLQKKAKNTLNSLKLNEKQKYPDSISAQINQSKRLHRIHSALVAVLEMVEFHHLSNIQWKINSLTLSDAERVCNVWYSITDTENPEKSSQWIQKLLSVSVVPLNRMVREHVLLRSGRKSIPAHLLPKLVFKLDRGDQLRVEALLDKVQAQLDLKDLKDSGLKSAPLSEPFVK